MRVAPTLSPAVAVVVVAPVAVALVGPLAVIALERGRFSAIDRRVVAVGRVVVAVTGLMTVDVVVGGGRLALPLPTPAGIKIGIRVRVGALVTGSRIGDKGINSSRCHRSSTSSAVTPDWFMASCMTFWG